LSLWSTICVNIYFFAAFFNLKFIASAAKGLAGFDGAALAPPAEESPPGIAGELLSTVFAFLSFPLEKLLIESKRALRSGSSGTSGRGGPDGGGGGEPPNDGGGGGGGGPPAGGGGGAENPESIGGGAGIDEF